LQTCIHTGNDKTVKEVIETLKSETNISVLQLENSFINSFEFFFKSVLNKPSNYQKGLALFITSTIAQQPFTLWNVTAGCGKSRIIAATALALLELYKNVSVHIVIPRLSLM
jgi:hypothetical protein